MSGYLSLIVLTLILTGLFAMIVASADLQEIMSNWPERRCEVPVVIAGALFKPSDDPRSSSEFSADNFQFCVRHLVDEVLKIAFSPLYAVAGQQMNAANVMAGPMNSIRGMITQGMKSFSTIFQAQYKQFTAVSVHVTKIWHHIKFAMGRIGAIVTSIVYFGLSASMLVQNTMSLIMNIIMVFIGILAAMILLIWFGLIPFIGIIIMMIVLLASADAETGGWISGGSADAGPFCVDPDANVVMKDGSLKPLKSIKVGDLIASKDSSENIVTGILSVDSSKQVIVSIGGVKMSETHPVFYNNKWMRAQEHPDAKIQNTFLEELICLNTTGHSCTVRGLIDVIVGDWDEASELEDQILWVNWAYEILNNIPFQSLDIPSTVPLCSDCVKVFSKATKSWINIDTIKIGDEILDVKSYTRVIGIYTGSFTTEEVPYSEWLSDGVWLKQGQSWELNKDGLPSDDEGLLVSGRFLVTESETFYINVNKKLLHVRDFTEVGASRLNECYSWFDDEINKKN